MSNNFYLHIFGSFIEDWTHHYEFLQAAPPIPVYRRWQQGDDPNAGELVWQGKHEVRMVVRHYREQNHLERAESREELRAYFARAELVEFAGRNIYYVVESDHDLVNGVPQYIDPAVTLAAWLAGRTIKIRL